MQIDVLSSNTLKLTLSKCDMSDLDIKYESLSPKNPETKRLLAHVLNSIQRESKTGFTFSGERLFVEAFPRADGGCMLYISCLEEETAPKPARSLKTGRISTQSQQSTMGATGSAAGKTEKNAKNESDLSCTQVFDIASETDSAICESDNLADIARALKCLRTASAIQYSGLYRKNGRYRAVVKSGKAGLMLAVMREHGKLITGEKELDYTRSHFLPIAEENAERICDLF
jgi:negative regulator of genetic competence, sporulation and motility